MTPRRTCIGCRTVRPQTELVRVVRLDEEMLLVGRTLPGRGAWLCATHPACVRAAVDRGAFPRAFRAPVRPEAAAAVMHAVVGQPGPASCQPATPDQPSN